MGNHLSSGNIVAYRALVLARVVLAAVGGYLLSSLAVIVLALLLSRLLAMPRADALLTAMLWSFVFYAVAIMYVFAARSVLRAALVLTGTGIAVAAVYAGLRLVSA